LKEGTIDSERIYSSCDYREAKIKANEPAANTTGMLPAPTVAAPPVLDAEAAAAVDVLTWEEVTVVKATEEATELEDETEALLVGVTELT
jgi:hypothetical protein